MCPTREKSANQSNATNATQIYTKLILINDWKLRRFRFARSRLLAKQEAKTWRLNCVARNSCDDPSFANLNGNFTQFASSSRANRRRLYRFARACLEPRFARPKVNSTLARQILTFEARKRHSLALRASRFKIQTANFRLLRRQLFALIRNRISIQRFSNFRRAKKQISPQKQVEFEFQIRSTFDKQTQSCKLFENAKS